MTRYTVVWVQSAQEELAELWINAEDRNAVSAAAELIDQELCNDPLDKGRELSEGLRSLIAAPLKAIFSVIEDDRIVEVILVRNG